MISGTTFSRSILVCGMMAMATASWAQFDTIPQSIAKGAVGSASTVPSGVSPSVERILRITDLVVSGTVGESRSYLSDDQMEVYTDIALGDPTVLYQSHQLVTAAVPGVIPTVTITQRGGTISIEGTTFTQREEALPALQIGTKGLFFLQRVGNKNVIAGKFYGAFSVVDGRVTPLMSSKDYAQEYRGLALADAVRLALRTVSSLSK